MPNWCYTCIQIHGNDAKKSKELFDKLESWTSKELHKSDFGKSWLGNVVLESGIARVVDADRCITEPEFRFRGRVCSLDFDDEDTISINTETAWGPMMDMWYAICQKYLPDAQIYFSADEPNCCLYLSNDPEEIGVYNFNNYHCYDELSDEQSEKMDKLFDGFLQLTEEQAVTALRGLLGSNSTTMDSLIDEFSESVYSDTMEIYSYEDAELPIAVSQWRHEKQTST